MATINGIPVYMAVISEGCGMERVSLVDMPAVMTDFEAFADAPRLQKYAVEDEDKRLVRGCLMRADFPIYRVSDKGEYYIMFSADTIRQMAEQYLAEGRQNNVNLMHVDGSDVEGVEMVQMFIKDTAAGIAPAGFEDCAEGSLFAEFKVLNDDVWDSIKAGEYKGFSIEVVTGCELNHDQQQVNDIVEGLNGKFGKTMSKIEKMKSKLAILLKMGSIATDKGVLAYDGDELTEGIAVQIVDSEGNTSDAEAGEYVADDVIIVVEGGSIAEIRNKEQMQAEPAEPAAEPEPEPAEPTEPSEPAEPTEPAEPAEPQAQQMSAEEQAFRTRQEQMSASYDEIYRNIYAALEGLGIDCYVAEAAADYCVAEVWTSNGYKYMRYALTTAEDGSVTIDATSGIEVRYAFVPVDMEVFAVQERMQQAEQQAQELRTQNEQMSAEIAELKKQPAADDAHTRFRQQSKGFDDRVNRAVAIASSLKR